MFSALRLRPGPPRLPHGFIPRLSKPIDIPRLSAMAPFSRAFGAGGADPSHHSHPEQHSHDHHDHGHAGPKRGFDKDWNRTFEKPSDFFSPPSHEVFAAKFLGGFMIFWMLYHIYHEWPYMLGLKNHWDEHEEEEDEDEEEEEEASGHHEAQPHHHDVGRPKLLTLGSKSTDRPSH